MVKLDPRFDAANTVLIGKSLGSMVAVRGLADNPHVKALVLLTPLCSIKPTEAAWSAAPYPHFAELTRPVTLLGGDDDPLCELPALYRMALAPKAPVRVVVVGGDHGFGSGADAARGATNLALAAENAADAAWGYLGAPPNGGEKP